MRKCLRNLEARVWPDEWTRPAVLRAALDRWLAGDDRPFPFGARLPTPNVASKPSISATLLL